MPLQFEWDEAKDRINEQKHADTKQSSDDDAMLPEYDFFNKQGVRGKYYRAYREGYTITVHHDDGTTTTTQYEPDADVITLDPDVKQYFPDAQSVNATLRLLIALIPRKQ